MRRNSVLLLLAVSLMFGGLAGVGTAADKEKPAADSKKTPAAPPSKAAADRKQARAANPAMAKVADDPALPRVLLIGDSISIGYTVPVRELLSGVANVHRPPTNCGPTFRGVEGIDDWLGDGHWDVIHFNWGLHDLKLIDGKHQVPLEEYEKNLQQLVDRMQKTGATLIWCSTTPVPEGTDPPRSNDDTKAYNEVAAKIMKAEGIATDDLYAFALPKLSEIQLPNNVHFGTEGSKVLAEQVAKSIREALAAKKSK